MLLMFFIDIQPLVTKLWQFLWLFHNEFKWFLYGYVKYSKAQYLLTKLTLPRRPSINRDRALLCSPLLACVWFGDEMGWGGPISI